MVEGLGKTRTWAQKLHYIIERSFLTGKHCLPVRLRLRKEQQQLLLYGVCLPVCRVGMPSQCGTRTEINVLVRNTS